MNHLDVYYRALINYRALTRENRECTALRNAIHQANPDADGIVITRSKCTVDEDWIKAIEKGLVYVEKAIKEERQFIYSQGEVEPIEKVKHISKESVRHLAKHSELITKEQEGDEIIPDKLYNVERLNDYAVYENRFLYMLLCYLRDFVTIRYNKILDLTNKYDGVLTMNKEITLPNRTITYSVDIHDVHKDDKYLREHNASKHIIDRIDLILKAILAFLATPLMEIAGKAAKLKPPITKTNVLKMDNNFKGAMMLYEYIVAYDKPGYTSETYTVDLSPFGETLADEMAEAGSMMTFLMYEYGLDLNGELKKSYLEEEARLKTEEIRRRSEQIAALKRRLAADEISPEEYIIALEKQVKLLEADNRNIEPLREKVKELEANERRLNLEIESLNCRIDSLIEEMEEQRIRHERELAELRESYEERIRDIVRRYEQTVAELTQKYEEQIAKLVATHEEELEDLRDTHRRRINDLNQAHAEEIERFRAQCQQQVDAVREEIKKSEEECAARIEAVTKQAEEREAAAIKQAEAREAEAVKKIEEADEKVGESSKAYSELSADYQNLLDEKLMCDARIKALKVRVGDLKPNEEYTEKEHFDRLELEYEAFDKFYKKCWDMARKQIRKDMINYKTLIGFKKID